VTAQTLEWAYPMEDEKAILKWIEMAEKDLEKIAKEYREYVNESDGFKPNAGSLYGLYYNVISMMLNQRSRMFILEDEPEEVGGEKGGRCTLCGIRNPLRREDTTQKQFWKEVQDKFNGLFKDKERLCAVCTVKRFYQNINEFNVKPKSKSVTWVATHEYYKQCQTSHKEILDDFIKNFNEKIIGQGIQMDLFEGLYPESYEKDSIISNFGEEAYEKVKGYLPSLKDKLKLLYKNAGNPPRYYAILRMDGDNMGKKLTGTSTPKIRDLMHPGVNIEGHDKLLKSNRLLNPNIHMAISRSLMEFSVNIVKEAIKQKNGCLVYSGGDDVLALLPANRALEAACDINRIFGQDFYNDYMMMGSGSTMSAGIVFAHYKYPLYHALEMADKALKAAKYHYGRSAFVLCDIRHSGQISMAGGKWEIAGCITKVNDYIQSMNEEKSISPRFMYRLIEDSNVLNGLDNDDGKRAYIKYLLSRHSSTQTPVEELSNDLVKAIKENAVVEDSVGEVARCIKILYNGCRGDVE
jgi:CRISPR-associated protein Cmr2